MKIFDMSTATLIIFLLLFLLQKYFTYNKDKTHEKIIKNDSVQEVLTYAGIDSVLNTLEQTTFENLDKDYLAYAGYDSYSKSNLMKIKTKKLFMITLTSTL